MPKKRIPGYRLHKPSGQAVVTLKGKDFYLGQYNSQASWEEYQRLIGDYVANDCKLPPTRSRNEITCEELVIQFLEWAAGYYLDEDGNQTQTMEQCRTALSPLVRYYGGNAVSNFGPLSLKFIRDKMIEEGYAVKREVDGKLIDAREEYARQTINSRINIIRQAFRWGVENELVSSEISHALDAVAKLKQGRTTAKDRNQIPPVSNEVVDRTLPFLPQVVADMIRVQRYVGGRPQDVCNMRPGDIDRSGDVWVYRPFKHKTKHRGKERVLAIGPRAQEILSPYILRKIDDEFIFSPLDTVKQLREEQREKRKSKVQPSQYDRSRPGAKKPRDQYDHYSYRRAVHRGCDKAGIGRWSPNQLRHTAGTETTANFSLEAAKEFLGHASIKTTEKYYVAPLPELAAKVAREIG